MQCHAYRAAAIRRSAEAYYAAHPFFQQHLFVPMANRIAAAEVAKASALSWTSTRSRSRALMIARAQLRAAAAWTAYTTERRYSTLRLRHGSPLAVCFIVTSTRISPIDEGEQRGGGERREPFGFMSCPLSHTTRHDSASQRSAHDALQARASAQCFGQRNDMFRFLLVINHFNLCSTRGYTGLITWSIGRSIAWSMGLMMNGMVAAVRLQLVTTLCIVEDQIC